MCAPTGDADIVHHLAEEEGHKYQPTKDCKTTIRHFEEDLDLQISRNKTIEEVLTHGCEELAHNATQNGTPLKIHDPKQGPISCSEWDIMGIDEKFCSVFLLLQQNKKGRKGTDNHHDSAPYAEDDSHKKPAKEASHTDSHDHHL